MNTRKLEDAIDEIISVAGVLIRCEGLPSEDGERIGRRRAAAIHREAMRRAVILVGAVRKIREAMREDAT